MPGQTFIHPTAVVEPGAQIGVGAHIGPFCLVGADVVIGDRSRLIGHVTILGATTLGADCEVFPTAVLGAAPQNTKHTGGRSTLVIGDNCNIREGVTMHLGTDTSRGETTVGANGNFFANVHIAHDCSIGSNVTMANLATLGGHCEVEDFVNFGGMAVVHQFARIGHHAFVAGTAKVFGNVIPYGMVVGDRGQLRGLNVIGMKRSGLPHKTIHDMRKAYRLIFDRARPLSENLDLAEAEFADSASVREVIDFIRRRGKRYLALPASGDDGVDDGGDDGAL